MIASKRASLGVRYPSSKHGSVLGGRWREFSPTAYTGLSAWYDINDINSLVYDGSNRVQLIGDKSGNSVRCLCLNGVAGNHASSPDSAAVSITGDMDILACVALNDWTPAAYSVVVAKYTTGTQKSFNLGIDTSGKLNFGRSTDGSADINYLSSVATGTTDISAIWIRASLDIDNGSAQSAVTFYTAPYSASVPTSWTQLGTVQTNASTATTFDSTTALSIGAFSNQFLLNGRVFRVILKNGIDGTTAFDADFTTPAKLATSFTESSSNAATVTINTSGDLGARISGERDLVQMTASKQPILTIAATGNYITFDGTDDYMKAAAFSLSQPETVYFVGSQVGWASGDYILDGNSSNTLAIAQTTSTPRVSISAGSTAAENTNWTIGTKNVITAVYNGASSSLRVGLGTETTGNAGAGNANGIMLGSLGGSANFGNFTNGGLIVYAAAHPASTQNRLINYLARQNSITL